MRTISSLFLISCLLFIFIIGCSEEKPVYIPDFEIQQKTDPIYETGKRTEAIEYKVTTYVQLKVFEDYSNTIRSKYEYVAFEEISKTKEDQMAWALKVQLEYEFKINQILLEKLLKL